LLTETLSSNHLFLFVFIRVIRGLTPGLGSFAGFVVSCKIWGYLCATIRVFGGLNATRQPGSMVPKANG